MPLLFFFAGGGVAFSGEKYRTYFFCKKKNADPEDGRKDVIWEKRERQNKK